VTAQPAFSFWKENHMKPAGAFVAAIEQGLSPVEALHSLPEYEPRYIDRVPIEVYRAAQRNGRRFFPVSSCRHRVVTHADILQATANLQQLRTWARESPNWALATGPDSGVFVLDVDGGEGLAFAPRPLQRRLELARHASLRCRGEALHLIRLA